MEARTLYKEAEKLIKVKSDPPHVPTIPLLSIYPKDLYLTIEVSTNSCLLLFYYEELRSGNSLAVHQMMNK